MDFVDEKTLIFKGKSIIQHHNLVITQQNNLVIAQNVTIQFFNGQHQRQHFTRQQALEQASVQRNIQPFARFLAWLVAESLKGEGVARV